MIKGEGPVISPNNGTLLTLVLSRMNDITLFFRLKIDDYLLCFLHKNDKKMNDIIRIYYVLW